MRTIRRRQKTIIIIAGPNGAGKTTFAREFLTKEGGVRDFINADLIAEGISPFAPEDAAMEAGRIMLNEMRRRVSLGQSFAFETTLAGLSYARQIPNWRAAGYHVALHFLSLPSVDLAIGRVRERVAQGGHSIPVETIRRRFTAGLRNLMSRYRMIVDEWALYDNSGDEPRLIDYGNKQ